MTRIHEQAHINRTVCFDGIGKGQLYPTDIDGVLEFHGRQFIFIEFKYKDAPMAKGQRLAYEHIADAIRAGGQSAIVILASHRSTNGNIQAAEATVKAVYYNGKWYRRGGRLEDVIEAFLRFDKEVRNADKNGHYHD